jgi:CO/xanthine dehydrogenase FAD-binding subunit
MQAGEQRVPDGYFRMEAALDLDSIYASGRLPDVLRRTLEGAFSWQRRNETTLERTLNMPGLAPQWVAGLLAGGALVSVEGKSIPLAEAFKKASKQEIEAVYLPIESMFWGTAQVARTPVDEPIVFAIAAVQVERGVVVQAKAALTGVWQSSVGEAEAVAALAGGPLNAKRIAEVSAKVADEVEPKANYLGRVAYRKAMSTVLTRKALAMCLNGMK